MPRSIVQHLEDEIARLEKALGAESQIESLGPTPLKDLNDRHLLYDTTVSQILPENDLSIVTTDNIQGHFEIRNRILSSDSLQSIVRSTMPTEPRFADLLPRIRMGLTPSFVLSSSARNDGHRGSTVVRPAETEMDTDFTLLLAIPPDVVRSLVKKYIQHSLTRWPVLYEPRVWEQVDTVLDKVRTMLHTNTKRTHFNEVHYDFLVIYLILAISATLGAVQSGHEARCMAYSAALFKEGVQHLSSKAPFPDDLAGVQALLLILQYAFINPLCANVWILSGAAMRSCLEVGLHRDLPTGTENDNAANPKSYEYQDLFGHGELSFATNHRRLDPLYLDMRRRIFWAAYIMDRSICSTLQRPLSIPDPAINAQYPSILDDHHITSAGLDPTGNPAKLAALRWIEYSRIQSVITEVHFQGFQLRKDQSWEDWLLEIELKLKKWYERASMSSAKDLVENALMHGLMSLHRPSPRIPMPAARSLLISYESACSSARTYRQEITKGVCRQPWLAAHHTLESALVVLFCLRHNREGIAAKFSAQEIFEATKLFTVNLLSISSQGWSAVSKYAGIYERLLGPLLEAIFTFTETSLLFSPSQDAELAELLYPGPAHLPSLRSGTGLPAGQETSMFDATLFDFNHGFWEGNGDLVEFFQVNNMPFEQSFLNL